MDLCKYVSTYWTDNRFNNDFSIRGYESRLKPLMKKNPILAAELKPIFRDEVLSRAKVYDWVKADLYKGFLAAMMWGGISLATSKKRKQSNAEKAFFVEKSKVENILKQVHNLLSMGREGEAFDLMANGDGKIEGIGVSYLTKVLYFFSPNRTNEALIFDKWGRYMHASLIIEKGDRVNDYYVFRHKDNYQSELIPCRSERELYLDYLSRMRDFTETFPQITSAGHLEAFFFGDKLYKNNKRISNPRYYLYNFVDSKCNPKKQRV